MRLPKLRKKSVKSGGKIKHYAVVSINGKDKSLGPWNSARAKQKHRELIDELKYGSQISDNPLVVDVVEHYAKFAKSHYRKNGQPTSETHIVKTSLEVLLDRFGQLPATEFGPRKFKMLRQYFITDHNKNGLTRKTVNHYMMHVLRAFRNAASDELVPADVSDLFPPKKYPDQLCRMPSDIRS